MNRRYLHRVILALVSFLVAAVGCELLLLLLMPASEDLLVSHPGRRMVFRPAPGVMPGIEGESRYVVNDVGLRGADWDPDSKTQILCIGGSTTECLYLDQSETWPQLVQDRLGDGVWVANAGSSGRHARDHVVQLRHLLTRPPVSTIGFDHVVLLEGANDLLLPLVRGADFDPDYLQRDGGEDKVLSRVFRYLPDDLVGAKSFPMNTHIYRLLQPLRGKFSEEQEQDGAGLIYETWRAHRAEAAFLLTELPDLSAALAAYRRHLTEIVRIVRAAGARPLLLTQPVLWRGDNTAEEEALMWMGGVGRYKRQRGQPYYATSTLARGLEMFNGVCREVAAELGVELVDLAEVIPASLDNFYDDMHFNEEGARRVADAVAAALR